MESTAENIEFFQRFILAVDSVPVLLQTILCQTGTRPGALWARIDKFAPKGHPYAARYVT